MRTRIKFCGLTNQRDIHHAINAGADALGLVFFEKSPRAVTIAKAKTLLADVPAFVNTVALVVNANEAIINNLHNLPIDTFQFHGDESPEECKALAKDKHWIKAVQVKPEMDFEQIADSYMQLGANGILLDGYDPAQPDVKGGTGTCFDWQAMSVFIKTSNFPIILAGGLTAENVNEAIQQTQPYAVDVSGGIEAVDLQGKKRKGIKDKARMHGFANAVMGTRN